MIKFKNNFNRTAYGKTRFTQAQVPHKVGYVDLTLDNKVNYTNKIPTEAEFNSLVAETMKDSHFKTKAINIAAAYVTRVFKDQFNINTLNRYDQMKKTLRNRFNETI